MTGAATRRDETANNKLLTEVRQFEAAEKSDHSIKMTKQTEINVEKLRNSETEKSKAEKKTLSDDVNEIEDSVLINNENFSAKMKRKLEKSIPGSSAERTDDTGEKHEQIKRTKTDDENLINSKRKKLTVIRRGKHSARSNQNKPMFDNNIHERIKTTSNIAQIMLAHENQNDGT